MGQQNLSKKLKISLKTKSKGLWEGFEFKAGKLYFRNLIKNQEKFSADHLDIFLLRKGKWKKFSFSLEDGESLCATESYINLNNLCHFDSNFKTELHSTLGY
ncbi:MAG: hypothetical protein KC493_00365 [Bacteriovoracaceae bacterium]|nr:hypothetical protein [Bacteriovoracaceae bacterium]